MPHHKYSKILTKEIMDIINDYIMCDKTESIFKFDDVLDEFDEKFVINNKEVSSPRTSVINQGYFVFDVNNNLVIVLR